MIIKNFLIALIFSIAAEGLHLLWPNAAFARNQEICPNIKTPVKINIRFTPARPSFNYSKSLAQIKRLSGKKQGIRHAVGLTKATMRHRTELRYLMRTNSKTGWGCVYLSGLYIDIGYDNTVIYVARKYKRNSCQYNAILEHEKEHIRIYNRSLDQAAKRIRNDIRKVARSIRPIHTKRQDSARKSIRSVISRKLSASVNKLRVKSASAQKSLDSPGSYAKTQAKCSRW